MSLLLGDHTLAGLQAAAEQANLTELAAAAARTATTGTTDASTKGEQPDSGKPGADSNRCSRSLPFVGV